MPVVALSPKHFKPRISPLDSKKTFMEKAINDNDINIQKHAKTILNQIRVSPTSHNIALSN